MAEHFDINDRVCITEANNDAFGQTGTIVQKFHDSAHVLVLFDERVSMFGEDVNSSFYTYDNLGPEDHPACQSSPPQLLS